jgi:hypothetical protein
MKKNGPTPMPEGQEAQQAVMLEWLKKAKENDGVMIATEYGMVLFSGKGRLDLAPTFIAVPIPFLMQLLGSFLQQGVAPLMAQMPVRKIGDPPLVDTIRDLRSN